MGQYFGGNDLYNWYVYWLWKIWGKSQNVFRDPFKDKHLLELISTEKIYHSELVKVPIILQVILCMF